MAQRSYVLTLHVAENRLGTVIDAVAGSAAVVSVVPTKESAAEPDASLKRASPGPREHHYAHGLKDKGIRGKDLVLQVLGSEPRPFLISELVTAFKAQHFAETTTYPCVYALVKEGKVRALNGGRYALPAVALKLADLGTAIGSGE